MANAAAAPAAAIKEPSLLWPNTAALVVAEAEAEVVVPDAALDPEAVVCVMVELPVDSEPLAVVELVVVSPPEDEPLLH
jgi:hypothetical protein